MNRAHLRRWFRGRTGARFSPLFSHGPRRCLLEDPTRVTRVAVWKVRPLHHQNICGAFDGIDPRLRPPCPAMAKAAGRKHGRDSCLWLEQDARAEPPSVFLPMLAEGVV